MMIHIRIAQFCFGNSNVFKGAPSNLCVKSFSYRKNVGLLWFSCFIWTLLKHPSNYVEVINDFAVGFKSWWHLHSTHRHKLLKDTSFYSCDAATLTCSNRQKKAELTYKHVISTAEFYIYFPTGQTLSLYFFIICNNEILTLLRHLFTFILWMLNSKLLHHQLQETSSQTSQKSFIYKFLY